MVYHLALQQGQVAALLKAVEDHQESLDLIKLHARIGLNQLSVRAVTNLFFRIENQFVLGEGTNNKGLLIERVLASSEHSPFGNLRERTGEMGRLDLKFNLDYKGKYNVFYSLELPANRDHRTVWMEMAVVTREDTRVEASEAEVSGIIDSAYELYCTSYAEYLEKLLVEQDVTYLD